MDVWPGLPLDAWRDTYATLHLWLQIVGKVRLAQSPWVNHSWHATLYVTATGLTTSSIPYGTRAFEIGFNFLDHRLTVESSDGGRRAVALAPMSVAAFYRRLMDAMGELDLRVKIHGRPNENAYAYPEPAGFAQATVRPREAFYSSDLREFLLPYDGVRQSTSPDETLRAFLQSTYEAAADLGKWDRSSLERQSDPKRA